VVTDAYTDAVDLDADLRGEGFELLEVCGPGVVEVVEFESGEQAFLYGFGRGYFLRDASEHFLFKAELKHGYLSFNLKFILELIMFDVNSRSN